MAKRFRRLRVRVRKGYTVIYWQDRLTGRIFAFGGERF